MKKVVSIVLMFTMLISLFTITVNADNVVTGENNNVTRIENAFDVFDPTKYQGGGNFDFVEESDRKYVQVNKYTYNSLLYGNPGNSNFKTPQVGNKYIYKTDFKVVGPEGGDPLNSGVVFSPMLVTDHWGVNNLGIKYQSGVWHINDFKLTDAFGPAAVKLNNWHTLNVVAEVKDITNATVNMEVTYYLDGVECLRRGIAKIEQDNNQPGVTRTIASVGITNMSTTTFDKEASYTLAFDNFAVASYEGNTDLIPSNELANNFVPEVVVGVSGNVTKILNTFEHFDIGKYQGNGNFEWKSDDKSDGKYVQVNKKVSGQTLYANPDQNGWAKFRTPAVGDKYIYKTDFKVVGPEGGDPKNSGAVFTPMLVNDYWAATDLGIKYQSGEWYINGNLVSNAFEYSVVELNNWHTLNIVAEVTDTTNGAAMTTTYYLDGEEAKTKGTATSIAASRTIASVGIKDITTSTYGSDASYTLAFDNFAVASYAGNTDLIPKFVSPKSVIDFDDYGSDGDWQNNLTTWNGNFDKVTAGDRTYIRAKDINNEATFYRADLFANKKLGKLAVGKKYIYSVDFMIEDVEGNGSWPVLSSAVTLTPMVMGNWQARNLGVSIPTGTGITVYNDTVVNDHVSQQMDNKPDGEGKVTQFYTTDKRATEKLHEDIWYNLTCVFEITSEDSTAFTGTTVTYLNGERLAKKDGSGWADGTFTWNKTNVAYLSQPALSAKSSNAESGHALAVDNLVLAVYEGNENLIPANDTKLNMQEEIKFTCDKAANTATATVQPLALKENKEYWLIVAAYDGSGDLKDVNLVPYTAELGKFAQKTAVLEDISKDATYVKAFIWSKDNIAPLADCVKETAPLLLTD